MITFRQFIEHKLFTEEDAPGGAPPGGPPGGASPMPMPPGGAGGPPGGAPPGGAGPAPGGAGGQTAAKKLRSYNFWDSAEKILDPEKSEEKPQDDEEAPPEEEAPPPEAGQEAPPAPEMGGATPPAPPDQGLGDVQGGSEPIKGLVGNGNPFLKKLTDELVKFNLTPAISKQIIDRVLKALPNLNRDRSIGAVKDSFSPPQ